MVSFSSKIWALDIAQIYTFFIYWLQAVYLMHRDCVKINFQDHSKYRWCKPLLGTIISTNEIECSLELSESLVICI